MLEFFRKYQRLFFIIITAVVVVSFVFFGTFNGSPQAQQAPDRKVVTGLDGKEIMQNELVGLCRLISTSVIDRSSRKKGEAPNLFNDSVIEKDLIASGMAMLLARRYFEELKPDLE
ncbi:MAG: SurA N-terminal domain-containing protein, partial [Chlamydiales bacterium]|nr:SurA N-terminal domain-containing protein [Chlamydiales bacterium]